MPNAALAPIAGAPRTVMLRMAAATSSGDVQTTISSRAGKTRWSIIFTWQAASSQNTVRINTHTKTPSRESVGVQLT